MAIDTAEKRASALSYGRPGFVLPIPSGTVGQGARQHALGLYSGILAAAPVLPAVPPDSIAAAGFTSRDTAAAGFTAQSIPAESFT